MVLSAFRRIPVPTPQLHIQPVHGTTLVNLRTDLYATGGDPLTRTLTLLGHRVTLHIHVDHYDFHPDDPADPGAPDLTTTDPGAPYPDLRNTHTYLHQGTAHPSLTTTWTADYRIDHGPWQHVDGTVTTTSPRQALRIVTATPVLTAPDG
jgi:hypothetical protein